MSEQLFWKKLSGDWYNQLGSKMTLIAEENGGLRGKYNSAVGNAEDFYILTGRFDACPPSDKGVSVGWVVTYRNRKLNAHSTATWSGQYFDGGDERIVTHWLLTSSTAPSSVWKSTNAGNDTFTRNEPSAAEIAVEEKGGPVVDRGRVVPAEIGLQKGLVSWVWAWIWA
ncbi:Avidin/streptavidin [Mycena latifolia]|nr:Avidin/streptavidin [Mycena latifolia]